MTILKEDSNIYPSSNRLDYKLTSKEDELRLIIKTQKDYLLKLKNVNYTINTITNKFQIIEKGLCAIKQNFT